MGKPLENLNPMIIIGLVWAKCCGNKLVHQAKEWDIIVLLFKQTSGFNISKSHLGFQMSGFTPKGI